MSSVITSNIFRYNPRLLTEWASPEDFTGTDTEKLQAALATGRNVLNAEKVDLF